MSHVLLSRVVSQTSSIYSANAMLCCFSSSWSIFTNKVSSVKDMGVVCIVVYSSM